MQETWTHWKTGWIIGVRYFIFSLILTLLCIPTYLCVALTEDMIARQGLYLLVGLLPLLVAIVNIPLACATAAQVTGWFRNSRSRFHRP